MTSLQEHNKGENGKLMSFEDIELVKKYMAQDLSEMLNWSNPDEV
jgi:hypothetical protein